MAYVKVCSPISSQFIMPNFSSILIVFCRRFTKNVPGNVDLHFSLILVTKTNAVEEGATATSGIISAALINSYTFLMA
jgi:hypothetical protein